GMKKVVKFISQAVILLMVVSLLAGCGAASTPSSDDTSDQTAAPEEKLKVGLSFPTQREEIWVKDKVLLEQEAEKQGIELLVQVSDNDAAKQQAQCENLLSQGIEVLIVGAHDGKAAATIVEKAHEMGVKVISFERLILDSDPDVYISFDNVKVGNVQGDWFVSHVDKGNIVILSGDPLDNNAKLFKQGAMEKLQPKIDSGDYTVVMEQAVKDWQPGEAMKLMENALTANKNNIQGVLAPNDGTAGGCIQALAAQGLDGKIPITGQDAELAGLQRIVEGVQGMTVFKDSRVICKATIEAAIKLANGEDLGANNTVNNGKMDVLSILCTPTAIDESNIDEILIDGGVFVKEDIYKQ
ncbi:MAG TPA: substrate-binding domain-containing protein, partial [Anaerovoracaceae bacterium]|nr:substrate-binding domain-containing protein [Anaerovoracaceae bacterium]